MNQNCWEFKKCGRQLGGAKAGELGVCPASVERRTDRVNGGRNGGRSCWAIAGTLCGGSVQGVFAAKMSNCMRCDFYKVVAQEQGSNLQKSQEILVLLRN